MPTAHMSTDGCEALSGLEFLLPKLFFFSSGIFGISDCFPNFAGNFVKIVISKIQVDENFSNGKSLLSDALNPNPNSEFRFGFDF